MIRFLKKLYVRMFPASKYQLKKSVKEFAEMNAKLNAELTSGLNKQFEQQERQGRQIEAIIEKLNNCDKEEQKFRNEKLDIIKKYNERIIVDGESNMSSLSDLIKHSYEEQGREHGRQFQTLLKMQTENKRLLNENIWAHIFHDTINRESWLKEKDFSPGRWAAGYPVLYMLYRVLNEVRPLNILELGLGQSTRMISQYVDAEENCKHIVVEHDYEWINFFENNFKVPEKTRILLKELHMKSFNGVSQVRQYKEFNIDLKAEKFDFIFIDAPLSGDMPEYARVDVVNLMPGCLADDFVIIIDDCNRSGEKNTVSYMKQVLEDNNIKFNVGKYNGDKEAILLCSHRYSFLCTM